VAYGKPENAQKDSARSQDLCKAMARGRSLQK
jgi:hypothetical protein